MEEEKCGSCAACREESVGPVELLEEYWFFHNTLDRESGSRSSTQVPCSKNSTEMVATAELDKGRTSTAAITGPLEIACRMENENPASSCSDLEKRERHMGNTGLLRAPSLPPEMTRSEAAHLEEARPQPRERRLQRSVSSFDTRPSFTPPPKSSKSRPTLLSRFLLDGQTLSRQHSFRQSNPGSRQKSLSELEIEEVQGFMDLGFTFNKGDIDPRLSDMIPGLQEKRIIEEEKVRRPYLSEAWLVQRRAPASLNMDCSSRTDMKQQLKVWARTVAFNVGQEC